MTKRTLKRAFNKFDVIKKTRDPEVPGILGFTINGKNAVEVGNRAGYVWVRLRSNTNEVIQAYNDQVSPVYGLPVVVVRDEIDRTKYKIKGRDLGTYQNWGGSAYLPRHGNQHSFNPEAGGGGDVVFVFSRQFMPLALQPSGTSGAGCVLVQPYAYYQGTTWKYAGGTGTASFLPYKPTGSSARMVLVYLDNDSNPQLLGGSDYFAASITGNAAVLPYVPAIPDTSDIPLGAVRLVSGTSAILWDNIYDLRPIIVSDGFIPTGTASKHEIQDDGTPLTDRAALNFVGSNFVVYNTAGATNVSGTAVSAGGGGGIPERSLPIQDSGAFVITGTAISFDGDLSATAVGSIAHVDIPAGTFASGSHTHPAGASSLLIYDDHVFKVTGTAIDFTDNMAVAVTGSVAFVSSTAIGGGGGSSALPIQDDGVFQITGTALSFDKDLSVSVIGTVAHVDIPPNTFASGSHTHPAGAAAIQIFDDSVFKVTGTAISFDSNLTVASSGTVAFISSTGGSSSTGSANHAYYNKLVALLEPDAIEPFQFDIFSYQFTGSTKYLLASWQTRIGSVGRLEVRDPRISLPLNNVTLNGTATGSCAIILDPSLPSYTDAYTKYYDRLNEIANAQTRYLPIEQTGSPGFGTPFLPGAYGAIITRVINFNYAYVGAALHGRGWNFANEISDTQDQRNDNALSLAVNKYVINEIVTADTQQLGGIIYYLCPSTWSVIPDATSYDFRDDFMGTSLDLSTDWSRTGTAIEINTRYQWVSMSGTSTWGANGCYSKTSIPRSNGKVFLIDVYVGRGTAAQNSHMVGFSDGLGHSFTNFSHGVLFTGGGGTSKVIKVYENGNDRGQVGTYIAGGTYRVRITLNGNAAIYEIQGGEEYAKLGSNSWTTITPGTTSSSTTPLRAGFSVGQVSTMYLSDVRIY